jgi:hypothetical protein
MNAGRRFDVGVAERSHLARTLVERRRGDGCRRL